jgi:hypothetical protein
LLACTCWHQNHVRFSYSAEYILTQNGALLRTVNWGRVQIFPVPPNLFLAV